MSKFIYIYKGPATPAEQFTEELMAEQNAAWGAWMGKVGPALVDGGAPFASNSASVVDDGSIRVADDLTGYSVVEAEDLAGARVLATGHPFLTEGKGRFSLEIFELGAM